MADMAEYYHQISEIQKAVREREIHRLELEKQRLTKTHRKEKRYEELRERIKEVHRELVREELEANHRFQNLLSRVDAVKREHQLLAAQTERLKQKKHQYEMQMSSATLGFPYPVQDSHYQSLLNTGGAAGIREYPKIRPPPRSSVSNPLLPEQMGSLGLRPPNVARVPLAPSSTSGLLANPVADLAFTSPGRAWSEAAGLLPIPRSAPMTGDSSGYDRATQPPHAQGLYTHASEGQPSNATGTRETNSRWDIQESLYIESLQRPTSRVQNGVSSQLPDEQVPSSSRATHDSPTTPASAAIHATKLAEMSEPTSVQSNSNGHQLDVHFNDSFSHETPSASRLPEATSMESSMMGCTIAGIINKNEEMIRSPKEVFERDQLIGANHVGPTVEHSTPDALNSQQPLQYDSHSTEHNDLDVGKQTTERKVTEETVQDSQIKSEDDKVLAEDHGKDSTSIAVNEKSPTQHADLKPTIDNKNASPNKEFSHDSNPVSKIPSNDSIAMEAEHGDAELKKSVDHTSKEGTVDTLKSLGFQETDHLDRKDGTGILPYQSVTSHSDTPAAKSPRKVNDHASSSAHNVNDVSAASSASSKTLKSSKLQSQDVDGDSESDFFDHNAPIAASAASKSLFENALHTESDSDDDEGQSSKITSKPQSQIRSTLKPFASSIPSLQPPPSGTDSDSIDSVEATIQAALRNDKKHPPTSDSAAGIRQPQEPPAPPKANPLLPKENRKPAVGDIGSKSQPPAALQLNLESDSESYAVSGGGEASDEDDFDFYDKF